MKIVKLYQWRGVGSLSLLLTIDGVKREIEFPTGSEKPRVNARYETDNATIQEKIEATPLYITGQIKCISKKEIAEPQDDAEQVKAPAANPAPQKKNNAPKKTEPKKETENVFSGVTNYQQASAILAEKFGADLDQLTDPETIMAKAAQVGATFPNLID